MAFEKIEYRSGDILTADQMNAIQNAISGHDSFVNYVDKYNQHWWSCLHGEAGVGYREVKTPLSAMTSIGGFNSNTGVKTHTIQYSNEVSVNQETGEVTLINPKDFVVDGTNLSTTTTTVKNLAALAPVYITGCVSSGVYYLPEGTTATASGSSVTTTTIMGSPFDNNCYSILMLPESKATIVASAVKSESYDIPAGETTYAHSSDRSAYPDSGVVDGITYTYLGIPFDNAVTAPGIAAGSYVGTDKYGKSNPSILTFNFPVKFIAIFTQSGYSDHLISTGKGKFSSSNNLFLVDTGDAKTFSWYDQTSVSGQLNRADITYYYFAIG